MEALRPALTLRGAYGQISTGAFADDATLVVASGAYLHVVDAASGAIRHSAIEPAGIAHVAVSGDGSTILTLDVSGTLAIRRPSLFDASDSIEERRRFSQIAIDRAGRLAVACDGNVGYIVDLVRASVACELVGHLAQMAQERGETYDGGFIAAVAICADGTTAVTGGTDERAILWDTATGRARTILAGHDGSVRALDIDSTARTIATIDSVGDLRLWDAASGAEHLSYRFPTEALRARFDRDGTRLAVVLASGTVVMLERIGAGCAGRWQPKRTYAIAAPYEYALDVSFDVCGKTVAIAGPRNASRCDAWLDDSVVVLVDIATGGVRELRVPGTHVPAFGFATADGGETAVAPLARPLRWNLSGDGIAQRLDAWPPLAGAALGEFAGRTIALGDDGLLGTYDRTGARIARPSEGARPKSFAVSGDGTRVAAIFDQRELPVTIEVSALEGTRQARWDVGLDTWIVGFAGDGSLILKTRDEITALEPPSWKPRWTLRRTVGDCAVTGAASLLFVAYSDDPIAVYDTTTGTRVALIDDGGRVISSVSASADGRYVATNGNGGFHVISVETSRPVACVDDLLDRRFSPTWVFSRDGTRALVNVGNLRDGGCATVYDLRYFAP